MIKLKMKKTIYEEKKQNLKKSIILKYMTVIRNAQT